MKTKTAELIGPALDWAVELAKGTHWSGNGYFVFKNPDGTARTFERSPEWRYSTDWSQGGPLLERELITSNIQRVNGELVFGASMRVHDKHGSNVTFFQAEGPTPLIAAMRCYVASKLGDEIDIPEELK